LTHESSANKRIDGLSNTDYRRLLSPFAKRRNMSVAKVSEITASSNKSFDDAIRIGIERACKTLENVTNAWVQDHEVTINQGKVTKYKVRMKLTFILKD
jgi:flavin-binding protein dodecin